MAYNLSTIWYTVQDLFQPYAKARGPLKLYMFNNYLQLADDELVLECIKNKNKEALHKFVKTTTIDSSTAIALPSGFVEPISAYDGAVEVIRMNDMDEYKDIKTNVITAPSTTYPVYYLTNGTIVTDPTTIGTYTLWYYGQNTGAAKPSLVLDSNSYYSASSVQLVWPEYMYLRIVMLILKYLGISVGDPTVIQKKLEEATDVTI